MQKELMSFKSLAIKSFSLGAVFLGGISSIAYGNYNLFSPKTIEDKLKWSNKKPLNIYDLTATDKDLSGPWNNQVNNFIINSSTKGINIKMKSPSWSSQNKKNNIEQLKKGCFELFKKDHSSDNDYKNAELWCTEI